MAVCQTRMSVLTSPITHVFGVFFIINSCTALIGNSFVLAILASPKLRTKSNRIVLALALSDFLVGLILSPMVALQVLDSDLLNDCNFDFARVYIAVFGNGSSVLIVAIIALDRYISLTKLTNYNQYMTKKRLITLLAMAWIVPALIPLLRYVGKYPYLSAVIFMFSVPPIVLIISYFSIMKVVKKKEEALQKYAVDSNKPQVNGGLTGDINTDRVSYDTNEEFERAVNLSRAATDKQRSREKSHIKLAKSVAVIIGGYLICILPLNIWLLLDLINASHPFISAFNIQIIYIIAMLFSQINSTINPIIYYIKNPEFKRGFKLLFQRKKKSDVV